MGDHLLEEQEMEAEALAAIFSDAFEIRSSTQPFVWSIKLVPIDTGGDEDLEERQNHVGARLVATIPLAYPEEEGPQLDIEVIKVSASSESACALTGLCFWRRRKFAVLCYFHCLLS